MLLYSPRSSKGPATPLAAGQVRRGPGGCCAALHMPHMPADSPAPCLVCASRRAASVRQRLCAPAAPLRVPAAGRISLVRSGPRIRWLRPWRTPLLQASSAAAAAAAAAVAGPPPPGLSAADARQLEEKGAPSSEQVRADPHTRLLRGKQGTGTLKRSGGNTAGWAAPLSAGSGPSPFVPPCACAWPGTRGFPHGHLTPPPVPRRPRHPSPLAPRPRHPYPPAPRPRHPSGRPPQAGPAAPARSGRPGLQPHGGLCAAALQRRVGCAARGRRGGARGAAGRRPAGGAGASLGCAPATARGHSGRVRGRGAVSGARGVPLSSASCVCARSQPFTAAAHHTIGILERRRSPHTLHSGDTDKGRGTGGWLRETAGLDKMVLRA
jgi:hypothetical protein